VAELALDDDERARIVVYFDRDRGLADLGLTPESR